MGSNQNRQVHSKNSNKRPAPKKVQVKNSFRDELLLLAVIGICIVIFLGNFGLAGIGDSGGNWISNKMFGLFGMIQYLLPLWLVFGAFLIFEFRNRTGIYKKIVLLFIILLILAVMVELLHGKNNMGQTFRSYFENGQEHFFTGGAIGGCLANLIYHVLGILASVLVLLILLIACAVLLTEKSFVRTIEKQGKKVYQNTKSDMQNRRSMQYENNAYEQPNHNHKKQVKRPEKPVVRKEKVFRGMSEVTFDVPKKRKASSSVGDIHEVFTEQNPDAQENQLQAQQEQEVTIQRGEKVSQVSFDPMSQEQSQSQNQNVNDPVRKENSISKRNSKRKNEKKTGLDEKEQEEIASKIQKSVEQKSENFCAPPVDLLKNGEKAVQESDSYLKQMGMKLQQTLQSFGVNVAVTNISCGPSVTRYELQPEQGVKVSRIVNLADDIKLNLAVADIRIEAPIPGKAAVGIEVPNRENTPVMLRDLLESNEFMNSKSPITFAVGKDIAGKVIVADIAKMPHLLIAGATGSGKSVCINTLIMSILYKADPNQVKLLMIDPKVVELSVYNSIPHLCHPVETDPKKAAGALNWAVGEMTRRYKLFADYNVRDLKGYNNKVMQLPDDLEDKPELIPQIVIIVDELADLMMVSKSEVEDSICRLAQLARAAGIHLIIATQRPSVDVITGLIKANMPSRIAFSVSSGVDSRTIIDINGAEKLLGKGDMLFYPSGFPKPVRVQGAFVSDKEVSDVVNYLKEHNQEVSYNDEIEQHMSMVQEKTSSDSTSAGNNNGYDELFSEAGKFVIEKDKGSIGMLQRVFRIGFNRAARIMDQLEEAGVVSGEEGTKPRNVIMSLEEFENFIEESV